MTKFERTIEIKAPAEKIFAYVTDPKNLPEIWPSLWEVKDVKQLPEGVGSTYKWAYKMAGMRFEGTTEVTEFVPNKWAVVKDHGAIEGTRTFQLKPENGWTKYTATVEYTIPRPLLGKLAEPVIAKLNEREGETFLENLKTRLENWN